MIEEAQTAEWCRDTNSTLKALKPVWKDIDQEPDIESLDTVLQAEILRLVGYCLSALGRSRNIKNYQERGRDLLTNAIELFSQNDLTDKECEAKVMLALTYYYEGRIDETEIILKEAEFYYENNQLHPVYLQICLNKLGALLWKQEIGEALKVLDDIKIQMEFCRDDRMLSTYHNQAGIVQARLGFEEKAVFHYEEALKYARRIKHLRFIAINLNNLAFVKSSYGCFEQALTNADEAYKIMEQLGEIGWLPHILDTKAQIFFKQGKFNDALAEIDNALELFGKGEDYAGLTEALWVKITVLLSLDEKAEAVRNFTELIQIATLRIGEYAVERYIQHFSEHLYCIKNLPMIEEIRQFKYSLIRRTLIKSNGSITRAAQELGTTHQNLSDLLARQFTDLRDELGIKLRARRSVIPVNRKAVSKITKIKKIQPIEKRSDTDETIKPLKLSTDIYVTGKESTADILLFSVPKSNMQKSFGIDTDCIIAVEMSDYLKHQPLLVFYKDTESYDCGIADIDTMTGLFYLNNTDNCPVPISPSEIYVIGIIAGYCPVSEIDERESIFRPLS